MERTRGSQVIQILNEMLEEERAAVEAVIGLTSMATDPTERDNLQRIGGDEALSCTGLRARIEALGGTPSRHISDFSNYVLSLEYFPERLRTFGRHQRLIMERISTLLSQRGLDEDTRKFLEEMLAQHAKDITWCEQRANTFEASRYPNGEIPPPRQQPVQAQPAQQPPVQAPPAQPPQVQTPNPPALKKTVAPAAEAPVTPEAAPEKPRRAPVRRRAAAADPAADSNNGNG